MFLWDVSVTFSTYGVLTRASMSMDMPWPSRAAVIIDRISLPYTVENRGAWTKILI